MQHHNPYQAPMGAAQQAGALATGQYEFGAMENETLRKAGSRTRWWGIISLVGGILGLLFTLLFVFGILLSGAMAQLGAQSAVIAGAVLGFLAPLALVYAVVGKLYIDSGSALLEVVDTQGNDVEHLMNALNKMANAFRIEVIMSAIAFVLGLGVGVLNYSGALGGP